MLALQPKQYDGIKTACSASQDPEVAAQELLQELAGIELSQVVFFCSNDFDFEALAKALGECFSGVNLVGCTTAGEISPLGYCSGSITAIGFPASSFAIQSALMSDLARFSFADAQGLIHQMLDHCREQQVAPIKGNTFALTLLDGLSVEEERLLRLLNAHLGSIPLLGGSAADDMCHNKTHVYYDGRFHTNAAILLLVNTAFDFEAFSIHHLLPTDDKLVVTNADPLERRVFEINAEPAALEYARVLNIPLETLNPQIFALNPLSVKIGERYYPRAIQKVNPDNSLSFYCAVDTGIVLTCSRSDDMLAQLDGLFDDISQRIGTPQLILGYDCIFRRLELQHLGLLETASTMFAHHKVIGFNTYGEQFNGMHLNQTFTGVALGGNDY
ncbi:MULTISPECIES: nitric oxide-sensing protein NosP [unclassified Oceanobacter]|uniref:nitric oxide-sensing protein NosP n=1 Tax=unclassified Oceanobacter TaxID=2620260 RepID=UPI002736C443|nr:MULTISPECIES: nitric oxide-sensing protein NosP [unclassified Oceanobacter]MDP2506166.1 nitric oxide-sensing protein NosP [Oceanobacter sp. 3_MG-2023]MDP2547293.1 nitric oxide-sensing protein NosP [Oceanobacter sp. 4_MG-2023]